MHSSSTSSIMKWTEIDVVQTSTGKQVATAFDPGSPRTVWCHPAEKGYVGTATGGLYIFDRFEIRSWGRFLRRSYFYASDHHLMAVSCMSPTSAEEVFVS